MMTYLYTQTPEFFSELCEEVRLFVDIRRIEKRETDEFETDGFFVLHYFKRGEDTVTSTAKLVCGGEIVAENTYECAAGRGKLAVKRTEKRAAKISLYRALSGHFGKSMPWGSLTGIRPTKLLRDTELRLGKEKAKALFLNEFDVLEEKVAFAQEILDVQQSLLPSGGDSIDVYIGIPFCVTRCAYCSFASSTPDVFAGAEQRYIDALVDELSMVKEMTEGKNVRAVYVGGGTPTAIGESNLERILDIASRIGADEFTVEAGRPDTITQSKLGIIKNSGAGRISVNAQTLRDDTLERIGRCHTAQDFFDAFALTRKAGFDSINVDVIAGLPGESAVDLADTLGRIISLQPENITVHSLAVKRASKFAAQNMDALPTSEDTQSAIKMAADMLGEAGYAPYYMYRQKYMKGSMENVGYAKSGKACLYNIDNMEDVCSVAAFGAGGISKRIFATDAQGCIVGLGTEKVQRVQDSLVKSEVNSRVGSIKGCRIERAANVKDLREYIARAGEMKERKRTLFDI